MAVGMQVNSKRLGQGQGFKDKNKENCIRHFETIILAHWSLTRWCQSEVGQMVAGQVSLYKHFLKGLWPPCKPLILTVFCGSYYQLIMTEVFFLHNLALFTFFLERWGV
jgi:hypothetical protein